MGIDKPNGHEQANQEAIKPEKDWLIENRVDPEGVRQEFLEWLRASPDNVRKYLVESALLRALPEACKQLGSLDALMARFEGEKAEPAPPRTADAPVNPQHLEKVLPPWKKSVKAKAKC